MIDALFREHLMIRRQRCKCCHCGQLYQADPRNGYHQRYCSQPGCRKASKLHSQQRWRASPKGKDYFKGSANVHRVRAWRVGASWLLAQRPQEISCVTRSLPTATHCPQGRYALLNRGRVTRSHGRARPVIDRTYGSISRQYVTREHRFDHPAADRFGPADSG